MVCSEGGEDYVVNMKKILFITFHDINDSSFGGAIASKRNYQGLKKIGYDVEIYQIKKKSSFESMLSLVEGNYPPIRKSNIDEICTILSQKKFDMVFFDSSLFGDILEKIKKRFKTKNIVFFHNCEYDYNKVRFKNGNILKKTIYSFFVKRIEKKSSILSDISIVLSKRDKLRVKELYGVDSTFIMPITLEDGYSNIINKDKYSFKNYCLLFGPECTANLEAFRWFIKNVRPKINCQIVIAGKGMDKYKNEFEDNRTKVFGYVDNLNDLYGSAAIVVIPLLSGAGMKIKTAEALMYGKNILGTKEAFEGYDIEFDKVGSLCCSKNDFINYINLYQFDKKDHFNLYSREQYLKKYSIEASTDIFRKL